MAAVTPPRSFAERPKSPLTPSNKPAANDNAPVLGAWENGVFRFTSPEARETWKRRAYEGGVNEDTWHLGKEIDPESAGLMTAGFGGANSGIYRGPDGTYRQMNPKTIESQAARDHRNKYLTGKTMDQIAAANAMPGADEWVAQDRAVQNAANDNAAGAPIPKRAQPLGSFAAEDRKPPYVKPSVQTDKGAGQMMAGRFGAMKPIADARVADKYDIRKPAGKWVKGVFVFNSFEDHERAVRGLYRQGVGEDTWHLGKVVDPKKVDAAAANPGLYYAPDGTCRLMDDQTMEGEAVRVHRDQYINKATGHGAKDSEVMPGEDEWLKRWTASWLENRPDLGTRFAASAKRTVADGSISGNLVQQFRSGGAFSPDTLATRPPDRFLQSGSKGILDWYRMHEDLGIGGGKRRVDLLAPEERVLWETEWGTLSTQQQAAVRKMWTEKQAEYLPWRAEFERETAVPAAETQGEKIADASGAIVGGIFSPDTLFLPGGPFTELISGAKAGAIASVGSIKGLAGIGDNLVEGARPFGTWAGAEGLNAEASSLLTRGSKNAYDPFGRLPNIYTRVLTNEEAYHLTGNETGLAFVLETPTSNPAALAFENRLPGRIIDIKTKKIMSPSLLFRNPNGLHVVRFDGLELAPGGSTVLMVDGKLRYPYFFNKGAMRDAQKTLRRWREALEQNPGYSIMVVFPNEEEVLAAQAAFKLEGVSDRIFARVIENE